MKRFQSQGDITYANIYNQKYDAVLASFEEFLLSSIAVHGINHDQTLECYEDILQEFEKCVGDLIVQGKYAYAKSIYNQLIGLTEKHYPNHSSLSHLLTSLSKVPNL